MVDSWALLPPMACRVATSNSAGISGAEFRLEPWNKKWLPTRNIFLHHTTCANLCQPSITQLSRREEDCRNWSELFIYAHLTTMFVNAHNTNHESWSRICSACYREQHKNSIVSRNHAFSSTPPLFSIWWRTHLHRPVRKQLCRTRCLHLLISCPFTIFSCHSMILCSR